MEYRAPALCTVVTFLLCVSSREVTVKHSDLLLCEEHRRACVTNLKDCGPRPATSIQRTLNMSCYYEELEIDQMSHRTVTCEWSDESESPTESDVSLIFSRSRRILSCEMLFNEVAIFNVTARIKNYMTGSETWSKPHTVYLSEAVKPSPPVLSVDGHTVDSVVVSWGCMYGCSCRLQYRDNRSHTWTRAPDSVSLSEGQTLTYTIRDLQQFTVYRAAVSCREDSDIWSRWSNEVTARTLDRAPSSAPDVCYRAEKSESGDLFLLHLMWKDLDLLDAGSRILGYQVSYEPERNQNLQDRVTQNVTEGTALLVVEAGNCSVSVRAFNTAGYGPAARLSIDTQRRETLPSVRNLWASSSPEGLLVRWETPVDPPPSLMPVSLFAVQWHSETRASSDRRTTVDNISTSTLIRDVDPEDSYLISVFPVYNQQCGPPQSLPASLQQGALREAVKLKVVGVTKTSVTVTWVWQQKSGPIRVQGYSVVLRTDSQTHSLSLWPDQQQHTFHDLEPSTEYSLHLLADNTSRSILTVTTDFNEVLVVAAATPLLLLAVVVFIVSILSRTTYKSYFFPPISSPRCSTTGQWLMDPKHQRPGEGNILYVDDFHVTDVLGEKSLITVSPNSEPPSEKDLHEDASLLPIRHLVITLDPDYVSDAPVFPDPVPSSFQTPYHPVYSVNCPHVDQDQEEFASEESREVDSASHADACFPQKEEDGSGRISEISRLRETVMKSLFQEFMRNTHQTSCEDEYVGNSSSFQGTRDVETNCSPICDNDYIANSCFTANANANTTTTRC
ncbi:interleukin-6 receptor subunit beta [Notolabrus celidotus]|uniref:interleukin-6 receptor subunit beta n=1 Tax=Notolabrus celidotus TaxID=1203425 RepID=UPI00148F7C4D|nr:interleukin-6 receptor subunit beta [Notolabrus celidotus]